jgi:hypothetical protein
MFNVILQNWIKHLHPNYKSMANDDNWIVDGRLHSNLGQDVAFFIPYTLAQWWWKEGIVRVNRDSKYNATPILPIVCGEHPNGHGEQGS